MPTPPEGRVRKALAPFSVDKVISGLPN